MTEAWRVRSIERQRLLEELMKEVFLFEDKNEGHKMFNASLWMADVIVEYLFSVWGGLEISSNYAVKAEASDLFEKNFLPKIKSFARAETEAHFLLAEFLKKILESALTPIYSAIMALEIHDPQLIFHASSAMAPAQLPEKF